MNDMQATEGLTFREWNQSPPYLSELIALDLEIFNFERTAMVLIRMQD